MITDWQIQHHGDAIILGFATQYAVLDIVSDRAQLTESLSLLRSPQNGLVHVRLGSFGEFPITLSLHDDGRVSIFIDGPAFDSTRVQSAAIWVERQQLQEILEDITRSTSPRID